MAAVSEVYNGPVTEEILLGALGKGLKFEQRVQISEAVHEFVIRSQVEV